VNLQSVASVRGVVEQLSYDHKPKAIVLQSNVGDSQSVASVRGVVEQLSYDRESPTLPCNTIALGL
jgi:hypothetical protein